MPNNKDRFRPPGRRQAAEPEPEQQRQGQEGEEWRCEEGGRTQAERPGALPERETPPGIGLSGQPQLQGHR